MRQQNTMDAPLKAPAPTAGAAAYVFKDEILDKLLPTLALVLEQ